MGSDDDRYGTATPHREQNLKLIAHDQFGLWFDVPAAVDTSPEPGWEFSRCYRAVLLIPNHGW